MEERRISRGRQGDLGESSAIEWFTRLGAIVFTPLGCSPDVDLVALHEGNALRVQVKTSAQEAETSSGSMRYPVALVTSGGNRSWSGKVKRIDPDLVDYVFALTVSGRRWCIPTPALEAFNQVSLGGAKYSEYEIEPTGPIRHLVFCEDPSLDCPSLGEYPSGQRTAPVKRQAQPSQVRILPPPSHGEQFTKTPFERKPGQSGYAVVNQKRRVTVPASAAVAAELRNGDRLKASAVGLGRILLERVEVPRAAAQPELPAA